MGGSCETCWAAREKMLNEKKSKKGKKKKRKVKDTSDGEIAQINSLTDGKSPG